MNKDGKLIYRSAEEVVTRKKHVALRIATKVKRKFPFLEKEGERIPPKFWKERKENRGQLPKKDREMVFLRDRRKKEDDADHLGQDGNWAQRSSDSFAQKKVKAQ